jgi:hypothetical protein
MKKNIILSVSLFAFFSLFVSSAFAWSPPSTTAPGGAAYAPINTGIFHQIKQAIFAPVGLMAHRIQIEPCQGSSWPLAPNGNCNLGGIFNLSQPYDMFSAQNLLGNAGIIVRSTGSTRILDGSSNLADGSILRTTNNDGTVKWLQPSQNIQPGDVLTWNLDQNNNGYPDWAPGSGGGSSLWNDNNGVLHPLDINKRVSIGADTLVDPLDRLQISNGGVRINNGGLNVMNGVTSLYYPNGVPGSTLPAFFVNVGGVQQLRVNLSGGVRIRPTSSSPQPGDVLTALNTAGDVEWQPPASGGTTLPTGATLGQVLTWNGSTPVWQTPASGSLWTDTGTALHSNNITRKIGVGTNNPAAMLEVKVSSPAPIAALGSPATTATGSYAIATGRDTTASGTSSFTSGYQTSVSGLGSSAFGVNSQVAGDVSFASGTGHSVSAHYSTALGRNIQISNTAHHSMGIGLSNGSSSPITNPNVMAIMRGRVGIDTVSPTQKLDIDGQIRIRGGNPGLGKVLTSSDDGTATWETSTSGLAGSGTTNYVAKWTPNGDTLGNSQIFDNDSRVGLGTNNPNAFFHVENGAGGNNGSGPTLTIGGNTAAATGDRSIAIGHYAKAQGQFGISLGHMSEARGLNSLALGYNPIARGQESIAIGRQSETAVGALGSIALGTKVVVNGQSSIGIGLGDPYNQSIPSTTTVNFNEPHTLVISRGDIRIGELPSAPINNQQIDARPHIMSIHEAVKIGGPFLQGVSDPILGLGREGFKQKAIFSATVKWSTNINGTDYRHRGLTIDRSGLLYQVGDSQFFGGISHTGPIIQSSDFNLKKNISDLNGSLSSILSLRPVRYELKENANNGETVGLIAQEVQAVYPELVHQNESGLLSLEYSKLVAPLIGAIQEQQNQISVLEQRIHDLELRLQ